MTLMTQYPSRAEPLIRILHKNRKVKKNTLRIARVRSHATKKLNEFYLKMENEKLRGDLEETNRFNYLYDNVKTVSATKLAVTTCHAL